jgi:hypothetical protein
VPEVSELPGDDELACPVQLLAGRFADSYRSRLEPLPAVRRSPSTR